MSYYPIEWWNCSSSLEQRQELCRRLGRDWHIQYAEGEASLEWLTRRQLRDLRKVSTSTLTEIEELFPGDPDS